MFKRLALAVLISSVPLSVRADEFPFTVTRGVLVTPENVTRTRELMRADNNPLADKLKEGYIMEGLGIYCSQRSEGMTDEQQEQAIRTVLKDRRPEEASALFNYLSAVAVIGKESVCPSVEFAVTLGHINDVKERTNYDLSENGIRDAQIKTDLEKVCIGLSEGATTYLQKSPQFMLSEMLGRVKNSDFADYASSIGSVAREEVCPKFVQ